MKRVVTGWGWVLREGLGKGATQDGRAVRACACVRVIAVGWRGVRFNKIGMNVTLYLTIVGGMWL